MTGRVTAGILLLTVAVAARTCPAEELNPATKRAARRGLDYLVGTQSGGGHWSANGNQYRAAMTALAGSALLSGGSTANRGSYAGNVRSAVDYLLSQAQRNGLIGDPRDYRYTYGHGFAMVFLAQVLGEEDDVDRRRELVRVLTRAVRFTADAQTSKGGWGYVSAKDGNDFDEGSTAVVQLQGLLACRRAGIPVPQTIVERGIDYVFACQNTDGGIVYSLKSRGSSRPPISAGALAAVNGLHFGPVPDAGRRRRDDDAMHVLLIASGPTWDYRFLSRLLYRSARHRTSTWLQTVDEQDLEATAQPANELLAEFPTRDELDRFDAVVAIDPDWSRLNAQQAGDLVDWVQQRGGGLILQAGDLHTSQLARKSASGKPFAAVRDLYPVEPASTLLVFDFAEPSRNGRPLDWTDAGKQSAVFGVDSDGPAASEAVWAELAIHRCAPTSGTKAGADVLATFADPRVPEKLGPPVALASQKVGAGRVLYVGTSETWRLRAVDEDAFDRFWSQALRNVARPPGDGRRDPDRRPREDDDDEIEQRLRKLEDYCDRAFRAPAGAAQPGHWHFAQHFLSQVRTQQGGEARSRYFEAVTQTILQQQAEDGSWTQGYVGPVYTTAINARILQTPRRTLPFFSD